MALGAGSGRCTGGGRERWDAPKAVREFGRKQPRRNRPLVGAVLSRDNRAMRAVMILVAACTFLVASDMTISVAQMIVFVRSTIQLRQSDRQVAEYLHHVRLTDKLDDRTIEDLAGQGAGPKTVTALHGLRDASVTLPLPPAPPPAPVVYQIAPPDSIEQGRILDQVREYALNYTRQLPDFICVQVTRRWVDPTGLDTWRHLDTITTRLAFFEQKEDYKVVLVNDQPVTDLPLELLGGTISAGEFGSMMKDIFALSTDARFEWERWATLRGKRNLVLSYDVDQEHSRYHLIANRSQDIVTAYRGLIYIDRDTKAISRITLKVYGIPYAFPVREVTTTLDYDVTKIGETQFMLPLKAEVTSRRGDQSTRNDVEFRLYRKFGADTTIKFDTSEEGSKK